MSRLILTCLYCAIAVGSVIAQQRGGAGSPHVVIVDPPLYDCGGPSKTGPISGKVEGGKPETFEVIIYSLSCNGKAYIQPTAKIYRTPVAANGRFRVQIHLGTTYYALLVRVGSNKTKFEPELTEVPSVGGDILDVATAAGAQPR